MKWFHHDCSARHDPRLQTLGGAFGIEGIGIYWSLLEEIGAHSDTFHLKVSGLSPEADQKFSELCDDSVTMHDNSLPILPSVAGIPRIPLRLLARQLFISSKKLRSVISLSAEVGLFDSGKWLKYNVLHSPAFEQRADDYTRRQHRRQDIVRVDAEESTDNVRTHSRDIDRTVSELCAEFDATKSDKLLPETEQEQKENRSRKEEIMPCNAKRQLEISTFDPQKMAEDGMAFIQLSEDEFLRYCKNCYLIIRRWNETHTQRFEWQPTEVELKKLFYGGQNRHKMNLCYQAINVQGGEVKYAELVLRAVRLMLDASTRHRITNPFGWVWSCLHGNGDGTTPWVALLTSGEENGRRHPRGPVSNKQATRSPP